MLTLMAKRCKAQSNAMRNDEDVEAICLNEDSMPPCFYDDILHGYYIANVIDFTPGSGGNLQDPLGQSKAMQPMHRSEQECTATHAQHMQSNAKRSDAKQV